MGVHLDIPGALSNPSKTWLVIQLYASSDRRSHGEGIVPNTLQFIHAEGILTTVKQARVEVNHFVSEDPHVGDLCTIYISP